MKFFNEYYTDVIKSIQNLDKDKQKLNSISNHFVNKAGTKLNNQGILFKKIEKNDD